MESVEFEWKVWQRNRLQNIIRISIWKMNNGWKFRVERNWKIERRKQMKEASKTENDTVKQRERERQTWQTEIHTDRMRQTHRETERRTKNEMKRTNTNIEAEMKKRWQGKVEIKSELNLWFWIIDGKIKIEWVSRWKK